jgi:hypothetical protein
MEDFSESVSLNEFTLDDFRIDLSKYIQSNRKALQDAALGLYTVVPVDPNYQVIAPGVIFCLRQKRAAPENETVNPLQPYFLVYVRDDGNVRFGFAQPKQILEMYRTLCAGRTVAYDDLCGLFDQMTHDGSEMSTYTELLEKAVDSIVHTYKTRAAGALLAGRGGRIVPQSQQITHATDFELITWLVIK